MKKNQSIKTVLTITIGFVIIYLFKKWNWALYIGLAIGLLGLFSPFLAKLIDKLWMQLAWLLSKIVPNILLTLMFFLILTPVAFLSRIFGKKDPLQRKNTTTTLFKNRTTSYSKSSFEKPW